MTQEVLNQVITYAQATNPYATILIGALPADNGISMTVAGGGASYFMDKGIKIEMLVTLNGKHENQQTVADALDAIHLALTQMKNYASTDAWQITNIETETAPAYLSREQNKQWLYGSSLRVKYYVYKGESNG